MSKVVRISHNPLTNVSGMNASDVFNRKMMLESKNTVVITTTSKEPPRSRSYNTKLAAAKLSQSMRRFPKAVAPGTLKTLLRYIPFS